MLARCYQMLKQFDKGIAESEECITIAKERGDRAKQGKVTRELGVCVWGLGQSSRAIALSEQAKEIAKEVGDRMGAGKACVSLALCYAGIHELG